MNHTFVFRARRCDFGELQAAGEVWLPIGASWGVVVTRPWMEGSYQIGAFGFSLLHGRGRGFQGSSFAFTG